MDFRLAMWTTSSDARPGPFRANVMNSSPSSPDTHETPKSADLSREPASRSSLSESALLGQTRLEDPKQEAVRTRFSFLAEAHGPDELGWLGSYRIGGVLGEGGMGVVFDAEDTQLCRRVALKILKPELALTPTLRERFLQEARAAAGEAEIIPVYSFAQSRGFRNTSTNSASCDPGLGR